MEPAGNDFDLLVRAEASLAAGDFGDALTAASEAVEVSRMSTSRALDLARALRLKALALEGLERTEEAMGAWSEARAFFSGLGIAEGVAECDARLNL